MAGEISAAYLSQASLYFDITATSGQLFYNNASGTFQAYISGQQTSFGINLTEVGITGIYFGDFPVGINPGQYGIVLKQQMGGSRADTDPNRGIQNFEWKGNGVLPRSDLATSGQLGLLAPIKIYRGEMVQNFPFKMVSSADHVTPFVSGVISGQISRDGAAFTALQSGAFVEVGLGWYALQALTSGDLLANTCCIVFTGVGISGGVADQRDFGLILQRVSGSV